MVVSVARKKININYKVIHEIHIKDENNNKYWRSFLKPENLINSFIAILTLISVILVWFTLIEMKQQRESTYKPVIAIMCSDEFVVKTNISQPDFYLSVPDYNAVEGSGYKMEGFQIPYLYFTIENIGLGSARNVKIQWSQDTFSQFVECIETNGRYEDLKLIEDGDLKRIFSEDDIVFETNWSNDYKIPYINTTENGSGVYKLDAGILGYLIGFCAFCSSDIPSLELKITYEDIYGKTYVANTYINIKSSRFRNDMESNYLIDFEMQVNYLDG